MQRLAGRTAGLVRICLAGRTAARSELILASSPEQTSVTTAVAWWGGGDAGGEAGHLGQAHKAVQHRLHGPHTAGAVAAVQRGGGCGQHRVSMLLQQAAVPGQEEAAVLAVPGAAV